MITIEVYDSPKTIDRYTVVITQGDEQDFYGMSEYALGFNLYIGSKVDGYKKGKHLGKKLKQVPDSILNAIKGRL